MRASSCRGLRIASILASAAASAVAALPAQAQGIAGSGPLACLILPERVAELGNPAAGVVESIAVDRGDTVRKGDVLVRMRAEVERAGIAVARSRADSEADLRGAVAARDLAQLKLDRAKTLAAQNFISSQALEQADSEFRVAAEKTALAREQLGTTRHEASLSQAQLAQRTLRAPFDGVVVERYANPGERFEDKPLLKIASITVLRVEVVAHVSYFGSLHVGQELPVQPELPGTAPRNARVAQIDRVLDPASNSFRLRLELPNADGALPAGLRCRIDLGKALPPEASAGPDGSRMAARRAATLLTQSDAPRPAR